MDLFRNPAYRSLLAFGVVFIKSAYDKPLLRAYIKTTLSNMNVTIDDVNNLINDLKKLDI